MSESQGQSNNLSWQLNAITEVLGDLAIEVNGHLTLGRGKDNDIVLGSKQVSRNHAEINLLNGRLYVKDLNSSNGIFINDVRIDAEKSKNLKDGDVLRIATLSFKVESIKEQRDASPVITDKPVAHEDVKTDAKLTPDTTEIEPEPKPESKSETKKAESVTVPVQPLQPSVAQEVSEDGENTTQTTTPNEMQAAQPKQDQPASAANPVEKPKEEIKEKTGEKSKLQPEPAIKKTEDIMPNSKSAPSAPTGGEVKTTTTELQQEADKDVLRAKQAATAQLSGTANLSDSKDVGTQGNNALDQAQSNPATSADNAKKASGGWFIWVFIAIIIIAGIIWMMNSGG